jgi:hypothetical protein
MPAADYDDVKNHVPMLRHEGGDCRECAAKGKGVGQA